MPTVPGYHGDDQSEAARARSGRDRLSRADQGVRRRRRPRHAPRRRCQGFQGRACRRQAEAESGLRRRLGPAREIHPRPASSRSSARRRPRRQRSCICSSATARSSATTRSSWKRPPPRTFRTACARELFDAALKLGRTIGYDSPARSSSSWTGTATLIFPGNEHAAPGRASRHRAHHRCRSRRMAIAGGGRARSCR